MFLQGALLRRDNAAIYEAPSTDGLGLPRSEVYNHQESHTVSDDTPTSLMPVSLGEYVSFPGTPQDPGRGGLLS